MKKRYIHPIRTTTISEILLRLGYDPVFYPYHRPDGNNKKAGGH